MNGLAIAALPLGHAGLGALSTGFPGAPALTIRIDAALGILAEAAVEQAGIQKPEPVGSIETMRARRP
jgi:hypothetical protein